VRQKSGAHSPAPIARPASPQARRTPALPYASAVAPLSPASPPQCLRRVRHVSDRSTCIRRDPGEASPRPVNLSTRHRWHARAPTIRRLPSTSSRVRASFRQGESERGS
jgi:hypothetical protein